MHPLARKLCFTLYYVNVKHGVTVSCCRDSMWEADRNASAAERGYHTWQVLMEPPSCTPKNDVLIGIPGSRGSGVTPTATVEGERRVADARPPDTSGTTPSPPPTRAPSSPRSSPHPLAAAPAPLAPPTAAAASIAAAAAAAAVIISPPPAVFSCTLGGTPNIHGSSGPAGCSPALLTAGSGGGGCGGGSWTWAGAAEEYAAGLSVDAETPSAAVFASLLRGGYETRDDTVVP